MICFSPESLSIRRFRRPCENAVIEVYNPPLSLHQYRLLQALWDTGGGVVTRDAIINTVWPEASGEGVSEQAIDALVRRLRDRLAEIDPEWQYVITVRGHGFRLEQG